MKLARTLERGLPLASVMLGRPEGDRPRDSESSRSEFALFSKMDRRLRTADEDRCSDMAVVWEKEGSNQHSHFPRDDVPMAHAEEDDRCENVKRRCFARIMIKAAATTASLIAQQRHEPTTWSLARASRADGGARGDETDRGRARQLESVSLSLCLQNALPQPCQEPSVLEMSPRGMLPRLLAVSEPL